MDHGHPMRVVAKRTGISPHLIRMWERRYSAIKPARTETGRRLYTDEEIERLILLRRATMEGQTISQIAGLSSDQLRTLIPAEAPTSPEGSAYSEKASIDKHLAVCLQSMRNLDAVGLEIQLLRASVDLGQRAFLEKLLHPLLEVTGERWSDGRFTVAHEHLASAVVRSLLGSIYSSHSTDRSCPLLVSSTPSGQWHEFGALMASVTAAGSGWRSLYLGPNLPAEDIVETAADRRADAIALSLVYPSDDSRTATELRKIRDLTKGSIPLLAGGRAAPAYDKVLAEIGAVRVGSLVELRRELERLRPGTSQRHLSRVRRE